MAKKNMPIESNPVKVEEKALSKLSQYCCDI
jgi:hypothetical protein